MSEETSDDISKRWRHEKAGQVFARIAAEFDRCKYRYGPAKSRSCGDKSTKIDDE